MTPIPAARPPEHPGPPPPAAGPLVLARRRGAARLSGPLRAAATVGAVLLLAGCGGRFDAGRPPRLPTARPTPVVTTPAPTPTACVTPATVATTSLPGARTLRDGLEILDRKVGTGTVARDGSKITVLYTGSLPNGTVFDASSRHGNKPFALTLGKHQVIGGWDVGLVGMRAGGIRELVIPASLGYLCQSPGGGIPADSTLVFTVHLLTVR